MIEHSIFNLKILNMKNIKILFLITILLGDSYLFAQQTVGLFLNTADSYNGYTLFAPLANKTTYLIDNCGEKIHSWNSYYPPGISVYLLENGILLRTGKTTNTTFFGGGSGGFIEMIDWNGDIIWDYTISSSTECQHHDIEYLPNGNILAIVWDSKTWEEAAQAGRIISGNTLWSEKVLEIQPDFVNGGGSIVWEWKAWDHLVQDVNINLDNYGTISTSPELIDINFYSGNPNNEDWLHINAIAYNEEFDQIILSNHNFSEIWVIDHSTTTIEAAGHSGGFYNKGGDLLYRWGNPQAYDQGNSGDQMLFRQHDSYWIEDTFTDEGMIMVFNNQAGFMIDYSTVNIIDPPIDANGNYIYSGSSYDPSGFHWTYQAPVPTNFYSANISGARRLPNGNTLICEGSSGKFFEVDWTGNIVWEYVNPVNNLGPITQGSPAVHNSVFRCLRYAPDYSGFDGQTLIPQGYIEPGSTFNCDLYPVGIHDFETKLEVAVCPNPTSDYANIELPSDMKVWVVEIINMQGHIVKKQKIANVQSLIDVRDLPNGVYIIRIHTDNGSIVNKFVKH